MWDFKNSIHLILNVSECWVFLKNVSWTQYLHSVQKEHAKESSKGKKKAKFWWRNTTQNWMDIKLMGSHTSVQGFFHYKPSQKPYVYSACIQQVRYFWHMSDFLNPALGTQEIHPEFLRHQAFRNWMTDHNTWVQTERLLPAKNPRSDCKKSLRCLSSWSYPLFINSRPAYKEFTYTYMTVKC